MNSDESNIRMSSNKLGIRESEAYKADISKSNVSKTGTFENNIAESDIRKICGLAYPQLEKFYQKLLAEGELRGLIGPLEVPRLWERHILNSAAVIPAISDYKKKRNISQLHIADVGSGAGFPGIVLATFLPKDHFTLIEPMERRVQWLHEICDDLQLKNVTIFHGRAEEYVASRDSSKSKKNERKKTIDKSKNIDKSNGHRNDIQLFDIVTCRAVARMSLLIEWTFPLLHKKGELIALKGRSVSQEIEKAQKNLRKYKAGKPTIEQVSIDPYVEKTTVVIIPKTE